MTRHDGRPSDALRPVKMTPNFLRNPVGSVLIEVVFNIGGMGLLSFEAIQQRDYPLTLGIIMVASFLSLLGNLMSDLLYVVIDPRISFDAASG